MLAGMKRSLRVVALLVWIGVLAAAGLAPTPMAVVQADDGWCGDQGCSQCTLCVMCESQPPDPPGGECIDQWEAQ